MRKFKTRSRKLARQSYWERYDRGSYQCPDCGRGESEIPGRFEVHHQNGEPMDNRPENHVALCRLCHNLREGKKPSIEQIRHLRSQATTDTQQESRGGSGTPSVYLAGSMDHESRENQSWRSSVAERGDRGTYRYTGSTPVEINSPTEVAFSHGSGPVRGIAKGDMKLIDESDAILAYFEKREQVGTITELVYAVAKGKPALVLFDTSLMPYIDNPNIPGDSLDDGIEIQHFSPVYWFLINFLTGDNWNELDAEVTVRALDSRDEVKSAFQDWSWHKRGFKETMTNAQK